MSEKTEHILTGTWKLEDDYKWRWLFTELQANVMLQFLGILFTLALPRAVKLVQHLCDLAARYNQNHQRHWHGLAQAYDTQRTIEHTIWEYWADAIHDFRLAFPTIRLVPMHQPQHSSWSYVWKATRRLIHAAVLLSVFVGTIVVGVLVVNLGLDNLALSTSPDCGIYAASNLSDFARSTIPFEFALEADSAKYAADCYNADKGKSAPQCNAFAQKSLPFEVIDHAACPFEDTMCHSGANTAFAIATPPIPATALGINTKRRLEFKREAVFTPLNMNTTYITTVKEGGIYTVSYKYGLNLRWAADPSITWKSFSHGDAVDEDATYTMAAVYYNATSANDGDVGPPIAPLRISTGAFLTIMLVKPGKIYYMQPSEDPIFATSDEEAHVPGLTGHWWTYPNVSARALAAVDTTKWRNLDIGPEWHDIHEWPPEKINGAYPGDLWLMWFALRNSHTWSSIGRRLGRGLIAQTRVNSFFSLALEPDQWKVEALQMFKSSLARVQLQTYKYARGAWAGDPAYTKLYTDPGLCQRTFFLRAEGYRNIDGAAWLTILVAIVVFIMIPSLAYSREPEWLLGSKMIDFISRGRAEKLAFYIVRSASYVGVALRRSVCIAAQAVWISIFDPIFNCVSMILHWMFKRARSIMNALLQIASN